ncbi:MAG: two-component system sensor histidine kinase [Paenibacillus sp.]|uniref:sensor histidine kinase n=1 Tax=Paenibacillus sp. GCM10012303 TaxID=3317340 RepID=UPI0029E929EE|nr:two-component system sensor histidine kinase [Paenibacillus sp.]
MKNRSLFNPIHWFSVLLGFVRDIYLFVRRHFESSIRLQLILTFVFCLLAALLVRSLTVPLFANANQYPVIDYTNGVHEIDNRARSILDRIGHEYEEARQAASRSAGSSAVPPAAAPEKKVTAIINDYSQSYPNLKILVLDLDGLVLFKSPSATENRVDLHGIIRNAMDVRINDRRYQNQEYSSFYPIDLNERKAYLVVSGMPSPNIVYMKGGSSPMPNLLAVVVFIFLFFWITKHKMKYIEELARGLREISKGNLNYRVAARSRDELGSLATSINLMTAELQLTLEEERRAEQTKTELITNVSHDLRTPLTLIMGYLRLLKDKNYESDAQADTYLNIAYSKSEKLKSLIDDLFEYTKLSSKGDTLKLDAVYMNELLEQLLEEMVSYAEDNELNLVRAFPPEKLKVNVDADKMIRVFDNLLTNAVKYSRKPGTVKVLLFREADHVLVRISNNGTPLPQEDLDRLFDRFYRVDASRSSETGGSGLGLAIAKSIIDYHGGDIWAESEGDEIRFWVKLKLAG